MLVAWVLVLGVAAVGALPGAPAVAQQTSGSSDLCDTGTVDQFTDVADGDYAAAYVLCMRALGLSVGTGGGSYGPDRELDRGQMASFLVRLWRDVLGNDCPAGVVTPFIDVEAGSSHAAHIECLYGLGITAGTTASTYGPWDPLRASQISRFLYRTYRQAGGDMCPGTGGSELDRATQCLLGLRVVPTSGEATATTPVTRAQMGVYVVGLWHNLSGRGLPPPPPQLATAITPSPEDEAGGRDTTYLDIAMGRDFACGLRTDQTIDCWGDGAYGFRDYGKTDPPEGTFTKIELSYDTGCGLRTDQTLACWGRADWGDWSELPTGTFTDVVLPGPESHFGVRSEFIYGSGCGLRTDKTIACWGYYQPDDAELGPPQGEFSQISLHGGLGCGMRTDGQIACWGRGAGPSGDLRTARFRQFVMDQSFGCGILENGTVRCWGHSELEDSPTACLQGCGFVMIRTGRLPADCALTAPLSAGAAMEVGVAVMSLLPIPSSATL